MVGSKPPSSVKSFQYDGPKSALDELEANALAAAANVFSPSNKPLNKVACTVCVNTVFGHLNCDNPFSLGCSVDCSI